MPDDLTRYRDALATILVMCDKDPCCPSCGHPNGLPAIFGVASRALNDDGPAPLTRHPKSHT